MKTKPDGAFRAFLNSAKVPGDDRPAFEGELTVPGDESPRTFALWARKDKNGNPILSGRVSALTGSAMDQIAELANNAAEVSPITIGDRKEPLTLKARELLLFHNRKKDSNEKQPDYYGWHHSGRPDAPPLNVSVWAKVDTNGRAYLKGTVQEPRVQSHVADEDEAEEHAA